MPEEENRLPIGGAAVPPPPPPPVVPPVLVVPVPALLGVVLLADQGLGRGSTFS